MEKPKCSLPAPCKSIVYAHGADETNPPKVRYAFTVHSFRGVRHVADHKTQEAMRFGMLVMTRSEGERKSIAVLG